MARIPNAARRNFLKTLGLSVGGSALLGTATGTDDIPSATQASDLTTATRSPDQRPSDWRMFRGDETNSGSSSAAGVSGTPWVDWSTKVSSARDPNLTSPTVADGTAYAVDEEGLVTALDVQSGQTRWQTTVEVGRVVSPASVGESNVYVSSGSQIHALSISDGSKQWTFSDSSGSSTGGDGCTASASAVGVSAVTVADGTAYVKLLGDEEDNRVVFALDANTGKTKWRRRVSGVKVGDEYAADDMLSEAPAVVGEVVYVSDGGSLFALDADAGTESWRTDVFGADTYDQTLSGAAVADGTVYLTGYRYQSADSNGNHNDVGAQLVAVGTENGSVEFRTDLGSERLTRTPAVADGTVFVPSLLWAVDTDDGTIQWKGDEELRASLSVGDETVYATTESHDESAQAVVSLDAATGDEQWRVPLRTPQLYAGPGAVAVVDETVYAADRAGYVYALSAKSDCWRSSLSTEAHNGTTVDAGTAFVLDLEANLYAFDTTTEEQLWKVSSVDGHVGEFLYGPVATDGTVFVGHGESGSESWTLAAFDAESGSKQWSYVAERGVGQPVVADGMVYFAGEGIDHGEPGVYALDAKTGEEVWTFARDESSVETYADVTDSAALLDDVLFVPTSAGLWAFDVETGDEKVIFASSVSTVAAADGVLYVGRVDSGDALVEAVNPDGSMSWRATLGDDVNVTADLTVEDDTVYVVGEYDGGPSIGGAQTGQDGKLYALSTADGSEQWTFDPEVEMAYFVERDQAITSPTVDGDSVFVGSDDRRVYELDASDGSERDCFETFGPVYGSSAVDSSTVYVGSSDGQLYGFER